MKNLLVVLMLLVLLPSRADAQLRTFTEGNDPYHAWKQETREKGVDIPGLGHLKSQYANWKPIYGEVAAAGDTPARGIVNPLPDVHEGEFIPKKYELTKAEMEMSAFIMHHYRGSITNVMFWNSTVERPGRWVELKEELTPQFHFEHQLVLHSLIHKKFVVQWINGVLQKQWTSRRDKGRAASKYLVNPPSRYDEKKLLKQFRETEKALIPKPRVN